MFARSSLAVMLMGTLFVVGCSESTTPTSLSTQTFALQASNADAAHDCQKGGYQTLFRTDGTGFKNAGECVSYAAQGGELAKRQTATLTNVVYGACNNLSLGYELNGSQHILESVSPGCGVVFGADQTIHYLSTQTLRLFLRDDSCSGWIFYEDGPHGTVVGTNPSEVAISDAGGFCESPPEDPRPGANVTLTRTITSG
jgi:putative hemolysin